MGIQFPGVTVPFIFPIHYIPGPIDGNLPAPVPLLTPGAVEEPDPAVEFVFCVPAEDVSGAGSTMGILSFPSGTGGLDGTDGFCVFEEFEPFCPVGLFSGPGTDDASWVSRSVSELLKYFL